LPHRQRINTVLLASTLRDAIYYGTGDASNRQFKAGPWVYFLDNVERAETAPGTEP